MDVYNGLNGSTGTFTPVSISDYQERVAYDPNGNIRTYLRNGGASRLSMDNLSYSYTANTNRLQKVTDAAADASGGTYSQYNDIKQGQLDNNYKYDGIGNLVSDSTASITNISWTVYGKIKSMIDSGKVINYTYDAAGNRILKATSADTMVYVRDATGNVLSIYEKKPGGTLVQTQVPVYGSSRLGMVTQHMAPDSMLSLTGSFGMGKKSIFTRGEKLFELSNHLGNVLVTVTDRRQQNSAGGITVDSYAADIASASDYYPFGMLMPSRNYNAGNYRYGFNGQEKSDEIKAAGNSYTAEFWEYDPRIGRRWNLDPRPDVSVSPYAAFGNNPILNADPLGDTLSNPQMLQALRIAANEVSDARKNNRYYFAVGTNERMSDAATAYIAKNNIAFGDASAFYNATADFHDKLVAAALKSGAEFDELNRAVIQDNTIKPSQALLITVGFINNSDAQLKSILNISANVAVGEAAGAVGIPVGRGPVGPRITPSLQQSIVNAGTTRVGQWMSPGEFEEFNRTGIIPRSNALVKGPAGYEK